MGAPSPELVDLWVARAFNAHDIEGLKPHMELTAEPLGRRVAVVTHQLGRGEAASTEPIADALLVTAKSAGAALVAGADIQYAKEASYGTHQG